MLHSVRIGLLPVIALASLAACRSSQGAGQVTQVGAGPGEEANGLLVVVLELPRNFSSVHHGSGIRLRLTNEGSRPMTIVAPGDGSVLGLRTPVLEWTVTTEDGQTNFPQEPGIICDTINAVQWGELVELEPGESVTFDDWLGFPRFPGAGTYLVSLRYTNDPRGAFEAMDESSLEIVRASTPCSAVSDPVRIERS
jgi:hypothetical protein